MATPVKERASSRPQAKAASRTAATLGKGTIEVVATPARGKGTGMYEITVSVDHKRKGSSLVLTSPRDFAFRKG